MVDSNDRERASEARDELARMLNEDELREAILLVFANKQVIYATLEIQTIRTIGKVAWSRDFTIVTCLVQC